MIILYLGMALCVGVLAGGGGIAATDLTSAVDEDDVVLAVTSTDSFLSSDYVVLGNENVLYTGKTAASFTGCTRGYGGTIPAEHSIGTMVYTTSASVVNNALGFNIAATVDTMGLWSIITVPFFFFVKTLPQLLIMPYQLFRGELVIFALFLLAIQIAIVITITISFTGARRV